MNNVKRAVNRNVNPDWKYAWKFTLTADLVRVAQFHLHATFDNQWVRIEPDGPRRTKITVKAGYSWDGCSVVPDAPGTRDASCIHDSIYQFSDQIGCQWNIERHKILDFGDEIFLQVMRQDKCPVAYLYYMGVRTFGGAFNLLGRALK